MNTIQLNIVSLEKAIYSGAVEMVIVSAVDGEIGILPGHAPLLTMIQPGNIRIKLADRKEVYYVSGGILEVQPQVVTILADTVIRAEELDENAALKARAGAQGQINRREKANFTRALLQISEATAQLRAIRLLRQDLKKKR